MLARVYRPKTFDELIGQNVLTTTLRNAFKLGVIPQGFLLAGPRGVGKTTTARLISKALEWSGGPSADFDPKDPVCQDIDRGSFIDVIEMDAASHTGVEEARILIERTNYKPARGRYKIFILDEVHMLSKSAFNALLKTLEEPPPHVKFIFATTEIRKVPVTVASRCQRFYLRLVATDVLTRYLQEVAKKESIRIGEAAARHIAYASEGSVRDALSLLDQATALGDYEVTVEIVDDMLGTAARGTLYNVLETLLRGDASSLQHIQTLDTDGTDPLRILDTLVEVLAWIIKMRADPALFEREAPTELDSKRGKELASIGNMPLLQLLFEALLRGREELMRSPNSRDALVVLLIRCLYLARMPMPVELMEAGLKKPTSVAPPSAPKPRAVAQHPAEAILRTVRAHVPNATLEDDKSHG